jgi:pilus assembly protein Flp/PilA
MFALKRFMPNNRGQGLIEYLIIVALMACATIGIVKVLNRTVQVQFANVIYSLQDPRSRAKPRMDSLKPSDYEKKDLGNFMNSDGSGGGNDAAF